MEAINTQVQSPLSIDAFTLSLDLSSKDNKQNQGRGANSQNFGLILEKQDKLSLSSEAMQKVRELQQARSKNQDTVLEDTHLASGNALTDVQNARALYSTATGVSQSVRLEAGNVQAQAQSKLLSDEYSKSTYAFNNASNPTQEETRRYLQTNTQDISNVAALYAYNVNSLNGMESLRSHAFTPTSRATSLSLSNAISSASYINTKAQSVNLSQADPKAVTEAYKAQKAHVHDSLIPLSTWSIGISMQV